MGGKWSKNRRAEWPEVREKIRQTPAAAEGVGAAYKEVLVWRFDSSLARRHLARELHPEYYKD
uniref:Protein Nef n=1 Tax=Human immunodeficiency virus type 1 TaxID=11676 RepID=Q4GZV7_HV1|nr:negative factor [Human immunodeficiency virus 1]